MAQFELRNLSYITKKISSWFSNTHWAPEVRVILYCLPYAGGDISIFRNWQNQLPSFIEVCPIRLPGRGSRIADPAHTEISTLAIEIAEAINKTVTKPYCLFGHSKGALLAFEVIRVMQRHGGPKPLHLFASGCAAPHVRNKQRETRYLSDPEFVSEVRKLNGTPPEFFDHPELVSLLLPMLRADFQACEMYSYKLHEILQVDITVLGGEDDSEVSTLQLNAWRDLTNGRFKLDILSGNNFFLHQNERNVLSVISTQLEAALNSESD